MYTDLKSQKSVKLLVPKKNLTEFDSSDSARSSRNRKRRLTKGTTKEDRLTRILTSTGAKSNMDIDSVTTKNFWDPEYIGDHKQIQHE